MKYKLIRDVPREECWWLDEDLKKDDEVFKYYGATYGCVSYNGIACTLIEGETPFFEVPSDALIVNPRSKTSKEKAIELGVPLFPTPPIIPKKKDKELEEKIRKDKLFKEMLEKPVGVCETCSKVFRQCDAREACGKSGCPFGTLTL